MADVSDPVLIVGAGPTGLVLAIELARRGVASHIIDQRPHPLPWDRAAVVKSRSLEIFEALGLAEKFVNRGKKIRGADFYDLTIRRASVRLAELDTPFPFTLGLSESETERILTIELERLGGTIERGVTFLGMEIGEKGAKVTLHDDKGDRIVKAGWVVGTDGLHSKVRDIAGITFDGHDYPLLWGVVDAHYAGWPHADDVMAVQFNPNLISIPISDGKWRIYFRGSHDDKELLTHIQNWLRIYAPDASLVDPDEPQLFHTHCRIASKFRAGRVLIAGDAAHACSPMEGHGMNVGIQDSFNLGWKLALVVKGEAPESLLDSYDVERRAIAAIVATSGDGAEATAALPGKEGIDAIASALANKDEHLKAAMAETELELNYEVSPIFEPDAADGAATRIGQWVGSLPELIDYDRHTLFLLLGDADAETGRQARDLVRRLADRHGHRLKTVVIEGSEHPAHARLANGQGPCLCLVRPDGHLGLRCPPSMDAVNAYFARIFSLHGRA
jgi:2-polyprenyl-6-methoxyphenol hydroxylase-like FAD-dependent oxidoreductase